MLADSGSVTGSVARSGRSRPLLAFVLSVGATMSSLSPTATAIVPGTEPVARATNPPSREVIVRDAFSRIDRDDKRYGAFTGRNSAALSTARNFDLEVGSGSVGVLDRRTLAVKANIDLESLPATAGVRRPNRSTQTAVVDAFVVTQILAAGGIIVGATNMDSWARGTRTVSEFGSTGNAFDPNRSPLGSSGGSAVAVATGMVDMALGTDTCGSIRYPASANAIFGLRPTAGAVSRRGVVPLSPTQDVVGPLARSLKDLQLLFRVIAGEDPLDPITLTAQPTPIRVRSRRVGVLRGFGATSRTPESPMPVLQARGYEVVEVASTGLVGASVIADEFEPARTRWRRGETPWNLPADGAYLSRLTSQARLRNQLVQLLDRNDLDAIAYPTTIAPPGRRGMKQITGNCWLAANSGLPALAVPGPLVRGFPEIGVDVLGRPFDEDTLFVVAGDAS